MRFVRLGATGRPAALALAATLAVAAACSDPPGGDDPPDAGPPDAGPPSFVEDTRISPLTSPALREVADGPTAVDYDNDGDLDLVVVAGWQYAEGRVGGIALLKNDGAGSFTDVAVESGLVGRGVFSTAAAFDYDNDGNEDLYVCNTESFIDGKKTFDGDDLLYRNNGDGTFTDVTAAAGIVEKATTFTVAAADVDNDGFIDIYVPEDIDTDFATAALLHPNDGSAELTAELDLLFHNNGDGTFTEESVARGVGAANTNLGRARLIDDESLEALFLDYDADGDMDFFLGNDFGYVVVYRNDGDGSFTDVTVPSGVKAMGFVGAMGFAPIDLDADGDFEVVVDNVGTSYLTYFKETVGEEADDLETYTLVLRYDGDGTFSNIVKSIGATNVPRFPSNRDDLPPPAEDTLQVLGWGWGISAFDYDNDGLEDLYQTGSFAIGTSTTPGIVGFLQTGAYPGHLLHRTRVDGFKDVTIEAGVADVRASDGFILPSWGHTFGDLDGDGFVDIILGNQTLQDLPGDLRIYRNLGNANHWLELQLVGTRSNRSAIGAQAQLFVTTGAAPQVRGNFVTGWSYPRAPMHFGLGEATTAARVVIRWPSGTVQELTDVAADQRLTVTEP